MRKSYKLTDLDCANCALKMEKKISEIEGVQDAKVSFMSSRLVIEAEGHLLPAILKQAEKIVKSIEPDCRITEGF